MHGNRIPCMVRSSPTPASDYAAWSKLWFDGWALWFDAATVMWLRSARIAGGGALGTRESQRMVAEKAAANAELATLLLTGGLTTPHAAATTAVRTYGKTVRANRRRLEG